MTEVGQVIRFDHRKGYGFIDVLNKDSDNYGRELFFHYSQINCENSFKKVFPGEVVSFDVEKRKDNNNDKEVCVNIRGVHGSKMMIDHPRYIFKITPKRINNNGSIHEAEPSPQPSAEEDDEP